MRNENNFSREVNSFRILKQSARIIDVRFKRNAYLGLGNGLEEESKIMRLFSVGQRSAEWFKVKCALWLSNGTTADAWNFRVENRWLPVEFAACGLSSSMAARRANCESENPAGLHCNHCNLPSTVIVVQIACNLFKIKNFIKKQSSALNFSLVQFLRIALKRIWAFKQSFKSRYTSIKPLPNRLEELKKQFKACALLEVWN